MRDFLTSRRARVTADRVGLPPGLNRRVPGLRRSEVAAVAGLSVEYYTRIERGSLDGVSEQVLDAIARALLLDDAEREHLAHLARPDASAALTPHRRRPAPAKVTRPALQWVLDTITTGPAFVRNGRLDFLAGNRLGRAFYAPALTDTQRAPNLARFLFLDPAGRDFHPDWEIAADNSVAILRTEAGRNPHDRALHDLVGELSTRSAAFASRWARHDVRRHSAGTKRFNHPVVGEVTVAYEGLEMTSDAGLVMNIYAAEPGSESDERLRLLGSWAATQLDANQNEEADRA
ncbi:MAG: helix-turn-helix transcriptional regulator [Acidimicrobiales bacterium]